MQQENLQVGHPAFSRGGRVMGRHRTRDNMMTFDATHGTHDQQGNALGVKLPFPCSTKDSAGNARTVDSTGAFLVGELERLDQKLHGPLAAVTWGRDIDLREDVTIADEVSSFTLSTFASAGGLGAGNSIGNGKAWIGKNTDQIAGVSVDINKNPQPLRLWGVEIKYTIPELESAARLGRPIDQQKFEALQLKHQMDIDEQVYIGDTSTTDTGLVNNSAVTPTNVVNGASGSTVWSSKSPDEILADINAALTTVWASTAWAVMPTRILIPPAQYGYLATAKVSLAGNVSILKYVQENNLIATQGKGEKLQILPLKWCIGAGAGGTIGTVGKDRMVVYVKEYDRVRYPMTMLSRTPIQFDSIYHKTTYFCRLGVLELVYSQTMGYFDQI